MGNTKQATVEAVWDNEAKVWVAQSDDVPGLVTEAESSEVLLEKLRVLIPELLEANHCLTAGENLTINILIRYHREDRTILQVAA